MIGRPRKPTRIKAVQGTLHKYRMNPAEPTPAVEAPSMPREFRGREAGAEFRRITKALKGMRTVARADRGVITAWCISWENLMASYAECARTGLVVKGTNGGAQLNPFLLSLSMSMKQIRTIAPELGITPASRSRVQAVPMPEKPSPFEEFLNRQRDARDVECDEAELAKKRREADEVSRRNFQETLRRAGVQIKGGVQ